MRPNTSQLKVAPAVTRIRVWYAVLIVVACVFLVRLFHLQIIQHDYYRQTASSSQLKEYEIPAERGAIVAYDGDSIVPLVLNETLYTLFADPKFVEDSAQAALKLSQVVGTDADEYEEKMQDDSRYVVLAKKLSKQHHQKIEDLDLKGIGTRETPYRTYPQGSLAAQVLGFVSDDGEGKYGVEQFLDDELRGAPGLLRAITDTRGIPLVSNRDNVIVGAEPGKRTVLSIDVSMQKHLEDILKKGVEQSKGKGGSALIIDPNTGALKAIANYPTYNPAKFFEETDASVFTNEAVSAPLEVGSIMKPLTVATALNEGAVNKDTSYHDPGRYVVDEFTITNVEEAGTGPATRNIADILQLSLNTGATWLTKQLGGGEINQQARNTLHDYMSNKYQFGKNTGIEQGYEAAGTVPDPSEGYGLNLRFANASFGQGMTATPLQMGAALSSIVNGGKYYKPSVVDGFYGQHGDLERQQPELVADNVVSQSVSNDLVELMEYVFTNNHHVYGMPQLRDQYLIGGKTGTAQIAKPNGGYYEDKYNGTFMGFVGGDKPEYVVVVSVTEPQVPGYAGSTAAGPIFVALVDMLIDNFAIAPEGS